MQSTLVISCCSQTFRGLLVATLIFGLLAISAPLLASDDQPIITPCDHCTTDQDFAQAATQAAPEPPPGDAQYRVYSVYVVNILDMEVSFFSVAVWRDEGEILPMAGTYQSGVNKVAYSGAGDPDVVDGLELGSQIALSFNGDFAGGGVVDWGEIDSPISSAIQLVGPDGTLAEHNRAEFQNHLNDYLSDYVSTRTATVSTFVREMAHRAFAKFVGDSSSLLFMGELIVMFDDDTWIRVNIESITTNFYLDGPVGFEFEIKPSTARLPDGRTVPQNGAAFGDFSYSDGSGGGSSVAQQLFWLAEMYGIEVGEPGENMDCDFSCQPGTNNCTLSCSRP